MITKYSTAPAKYDSLFKDATNRLALLGVQKLDAEGQAIGVYNWDDKALQLESLEEYFSNLRNLIYGPANNELQPNDSADMALIQEGYRFLKLPVDEPHFMIDANTRKVEVPEAFKQNGIAVVGDEVSEVLFFEIDRFYDATDLSQQDIAFFWSHTADKDNTIYSTPAFFSVVESNFEGDDKLIFGWPITSDLTRMAGKITFSVRFFKKDDTVVGDEAYSLLYSLSTQPQTVNVSSGLVYDIDDDVMLDNRLNFILSKRIVNSPIGRQDPPSKPVAIFAATKINDTFKKEVIDVTEQITTDQVLAVLGCKDDNGTLKYAWMRKNADNSITPLTDGFKAPLLSGGSYVEVNSFITNEAGQSIVTYYQKNSENDYSKILIENAAQFEREHAKQRLYVQCSIYTLTKNNILPGEYYAQIANTLGKQTAISYEDELPPFVWKVEGPQTPAISETSWGSAATLEGEYVALSIITSSGVNEKTEYTWQRAIEAEGAWSACGTAAEFTPTSDGYYRVIIKNTQNGGVESATSNYVLVLGPVIKPNEPFITLDGTVATLNLGRELNPYESIICVWSDVSGMESIVVGETQDSLSYDFKDYTFANPDAAQKIRVGFTIRKSEKLSYQGSVSN